MAVLWLQFNLYVCDMINIYWNGHLSKQYSIMIYTVKTIYIAVYRSQGKTDDEKELEVKANVFIIIIIQHTNINIVLMITTLILTI